MPEGYVEINGQMYKKPTKGRCAYCGSDMLEFYDDGSGICLNCGRTFSWLKPVKGPINPQPGGGSPPPAAAPVAAAAATQTAGRRAPAEKIGPAPSPVVPPAPKRKKTGVIGSRGISALGLLGALLISLGAMTMIAVLPMGSWPPSNYDSEMLGNIKKAGMLVWSLGTMFFLMAGFSAAGTEEMDPGVRRTLIAASVALAILSFSLWMGLSMMGGSF